MYTVRGMGIRTFSVRKHAGRSFSFYSFRAIANVRTWSNTFRIRRRNVVSESSNRWTLGADFRARAACVRLVLCSPLLFTRVIRTTIRIVPNRSIIILIICNVLGFYYRLSIYRAFDSRFDRPL